MDRDKSLEMAIGQIEKQFGKGSVMRMGEKPHMEVDAISTGALALDLALGVGGLPRGRIVEIYGPESSGKCLVAGTYVWTDRGLETVAELFERCGQPASCTSRITPIVDLGVRAVNERAELETVGVLTHNNRRPVLRVRLESGREVTATHNHPLRVVNERGFIVWREVGEIQPGDVVVSAMFGAAEAAAGDGLSEDEAVFLGYLVAEGSLGYTTQTRFTNRDGEVAQEYTRLAEQLFGVKVKCYNDIDYAIHDKTFRTLLAEQYGMAYVTAAGKTVPHCVRTSGRKAQRAFLSALFEGDGWIDPSSTVGLTTASEELARQVQLLLVGFGIPCTVRATFNRTYERDYWSVTVNPGCVHRFIEQIGFRSERRQRQVAAHFCTSRRDPQCENIPRIRDIVRDLRDDLGGDRAFDRLAGDLLRGDVDLACSRSRLTRIVAWAEAHADRLSPGGRALLAYLAHLAEGRYTYETVVSVEDAGRQPTFDLALPRSHSFIANGVLSHNTTLAMHVVAEAQRNGGICAYVDAEHAVDPVYARAIGVNVDDLLISQPDTGEQALEITDMLIRSGALDVLVIDSVAALTPRAEIEGEMGDTHVGLQARLMSQALRKLTATVSKANTVAIFINQLREKVGVIYGSPEVTPGGRALKFYSSVRLDIRRIESIKDGVEVIGNRVRVKVAKNKCLAAGTTVFDPTTGLTHRIEEIVDGGEGSSVVAVDKAGKLHVRPITARMNQGDQEVLGLRFRDGTQIWATPDHRILTDRGWREAGELAAGDPVARPRRLGRFGTAEPVPPDHARMLGYLIGDGYVGGKTPCAFINVQQSLQQDAAEIAASLGCDAHRDGIETSFSHRKGEKNRLLELVRWAGIWGHLAPTKRIPAPFFASDVSAEVLANLLFGIWESDGWVSREQTGGIRCGFTTTSEQLARQIHWLLLRWGIGGSCRAYDATSQRPSLIKGRKVQGKRACWEVRVSGIDNVARFAEAIPMWGPRGQVLTAELARPELRKHRGSQRGYLPPSQTAPVLAYLRGLGVTPRLAAQLVGIEAQDGMSMQSVLGVTRLRRDRLERLTDALESEFLAGVLDEDVWYDRITAISPAEWRPTYDIEVDELHTFVAEDIVVHNCASPFKQAEFDIGFGKGISREGSLLDVGVDLGLVKKSGAWYTYEGEQLGQGRENAKAFLVDNPEIMVEVSERIRQAVGIGGKAAADETGASNGQAVALD